MHGEFLGDVKDAKGAQAGRLWTVLDPDRSVGTAVYWTTSNVNYVLELRLTSPTTFELRKNKDLEKLFRLESEIPEDAFVQATWRLDKDGDVEGTFQVTGAGSGPDNSQGTFLIRDLSGGWDPEPSDVQFESWDTCKAWMDSHRREESLYRGQSKAFPLVSTFHRTRRVDLIRWLNEDIPKFADYVSALSDGRYNVHNDEADRGALVGIAQHHGFPTPLLDWSASPYVSAYFAFAGVVEAPPTSEPARIFRLTPDFLKDYPIPPGPLIPIDSRPKVELFRPPARGNSRLLAQQGMMLFTNVPAPETYIRWLEDKSGKKYLEAADVAGSVCREALADLRRMGITAASLFPGLDGIGRALKHELYYSPER